MLDSWNDGPTKSAIVDFVGRVTTEGGPDFVAAEARVAVFDNDGTLWCEKPMYIQLDFLLRRLAEQAEADPSLRDKQPYKAAVDGDLDWLGDAVTKHYQGDDADFKVLAGAILTAARMPSPSRSTRAGSTRSSPMPRIRRWTGRTPRAGTRRWWNCCATWRPTGSPVTSSPAAAATSCARSPAPLYGIPPERVVGSSVGLDLRGRPTCTTTAEPEFLDDGPIKPVRLWSRIGRRPIFAAGNSNGDIEMLEFTDAPAMPSLQLLVLHDDADREFDYTAGAEKSLDEAAKERLDRGQHARRLGDRLQ